jgi:hypothetical protein
MNGKQARKRPIKCRGFSPQHKVKKVLQLVVKAEG